MKKRIISLILVIAIILNFNITALAAGGATLTSTLPSDGNLKAGDTFTVTLTVPPVSGFASLHLGMHFEKSVLEVTSLSLPDKVGGYAAVITDVDEANVAGAFAVSFAQAQNISTTGTMVLSVDFKVKDGATPNNYPKLVEVEDDDYDFTDEDDVPLTTVPALNTKTISATILKAPIASVTIADLDAPVKGAAPDTSVTVTPAGLTADVMWFDGETPVTGDFAASTAYTVKIKLTASGGDNFAETVTASGYDVTRNSETELLLTKTFDATADKDPLTGSVSLNSTAWRIDNPMNVGTSGITSTSPGTLSYKWYRVDHEGNESLIAGESGNSYTPKVAADVGKNIKVVVTAENYSGRLEATSPYTVSKKPYDGPTPTAPTGITPTSNFVSFTKTENYYYAVTSAAITTAPSSGWTNQDGFTGLSPNTSYKLWYRIGETDIMESSSAAYVDFTTLKSSATITIADPGTIVYDGSAVEVGSGKDLNYTYGGDGTVTVKWYADNSGSVGSALSGAPKDAGTYWIGVSAAEGTSSAAVSEVTKKFTISQKALTNDMIILGTQATYDGTAHGPVYSVKDGATVLNKGTDYTETSGYSPVTNVGNTTLKISGAGNYKGTAQKDWSLVAKDVTITPDAKSKTYGAADPELTYSTDLTAGSALETAFNTAKSGALSYTGTDVGAYIIGIGTLKAGNNFNLKMNATAVFFTINQATPVITATTPRQLVNNGMEVDISNWASFTNTDSGAELTYTLGSAPAGITLAGNKLKAASSVAAGATFEIKVNAYGTHNFTAPTEFTIHVTVVNKEDAGVSITGAPASKTYGEANFTVTATKTASNGGTWNWTSSDDTVLKIVDGADSATATVQVLKASATGATLMVTYTSGTHYGSANTTITVAPKTLTAADLTHSGPITKVYDTNTNAPTGLTVSVKSGSLVGTDTLAVTGTLKYNSANVNEANKITFTPDAITTGNYALAASEVLTITGAKITQATPTYAVPTGLTAKYGQTLADVNIAATTGWSWMNTGTAVGTPATKNFPAKFTPTDAINYKTIENIDVSVAVSKADAPTLTNITVSQKYTVDTEQSKNIGNGGMPADAGALTYTAGSSSVTTGTATVSSFAVDNTGMVKYTITGGADGAVINLPVTIGSDNYADATINVVITLTAKDNQAALTLTGGTTVVYGQTLQLGTSGGSGTGAVTYAVTNGTGEATIDTTGKLTPVKVGTVKVKATKAGDASYNSITSAEVEITITRATPTGAPKYTAITTSGKTLADAGLTTVGSTLNPNAGTLVWVDNAGTVLPDTTAVAANTTYKWLFTPTDANYTTLTDSIELYHVSTGGGGGWYYTYYTIKATAGTNGSISPSGWTSVRDGRDQTFTITPDKGYAVAKVLVDGKSVGAVKSYTFKNVTKDHTIEAIFMKSNGNPQTGVFVDVAEGSYYEEAIDWAVEKGITNGVSSNMFAPNDPCTRAQIVTFLWRAAGSPAPKSMSSFTDVPADAFYAKAVAWAVENGITSGTGAGKFSPYSTCTRAQAVTFLYRASGSPAVSGKAEFSDVSTTAFYADAVTWAAKKGITTGIGGGLFGSDNDCTRGQIVTFLWRAMAE